MFATNFRRVVLSFHLTYFYTQLSCVNITKTRNKMKTIKLKQYVKQKKSERLSRLTMLVINDFVKYYINKTNGLKNSN